MLHIRLVRTFITQTITRVRSLLMLHIKLVHRCIHHTKNYQDIVYEAIKEKEWLCKATEMDKEVRPRRQREQDRARRLRETAEPRLARTNCHMMHQLWSLGLPHHA